MADETILIDIEYDTKEAVTEIDQLTRTIEGLKISQKELDTQLKQGKISQVEYSKQSAILKSKLNQETKSRRDALKVINATSNSYEKLQAQTNKLIAQSKKLDTTTVEGAKKFDALTKKINKNTDALKKMDAAQGRNNRNVGKYQDALKGVGSSLGLVTGGVALAGAAIKAGINVTKKAIEVNREFEKSFANVLTLLDEAQKAEFRIELERGAVDIMANYGLTISDVNKSLFDTISAGIPAGEAIDFMNKAAKLAIAGNAELSSVVDGATNVIGAYGDKAGSTTEVMNAFFASQVKGKTDVGLLATNIGKVASTAAAADIPVNELFGTFAGLTKFIGSTEESSTSLAATLTAIINPSAEAERAFKELGIETGITGLKNNGLLNTLTKVAGAYDENNDVLAELIPNQRALKAVAGLGADAIAEIEQNVLDLNDAEASSILVQEAFNEQMNTSQKRAEQLSGNWNRLLISIGGGESIFKKIGNGIKASLNDEISRATQKVELFKVQWQRLTGQLTKEEYQQATIDVIERFSGMSEEAEAAATGIDALNVATEENTNTTIRNAEATTNNVISINSLTEKVKELEAAKKAMNIADEEGIALKNKEIESTKNQIAYLQSLGEVQKEMRIEDVDFEKEINDELLSINDDLFNTKKEVTEKNNKWNKKAHEELEEEKTKVTEEEESNRRAYIKASAEAVAEITQQTTQFLIDQNNSRWNAELIAAGDNEEKKAQINKKYAKKQQKLAVTQAITKGALAVLNGLLTVPFLPAGLAMAAVAGVAAGLQIATIRKQSSKFEGGGKVPLAKRGMKAGTFDGPSHAQRGIPLVNGLTGQQVAEVEGRENFYVINKDASAYINSLSDINQRIGGGVPLSNKVTKMANGGQADVNNNQQNGVDINAVTSQVIANLPPIYVQTVDIKTGLEDRNDVLNVGVV